MKTPRRKIAALVADQAMDGEFGGDQATAVAALLLDENRTGEIDSLLRDIQQSWVTHGIIDVLAISAHELSAAVLQDIEAEVRRVFSSADRIVVTSKFDPHLVGGVRLEFADYRLDLSIARELQKFKLLAIHGKE